jgi:hypothetical protein
MKALVDVVLCSALYATNQRLNTAFLLASSPTPKKEMTDATWLVGKQPLWDYQTHFVFCSAVHST